MLLLLGLEMKPAAAQVNFDQELEELRNRQHSTQSEIETLRRQIERYRERLQQAGREYDEAYSRFTELSRLVAIQDEKIRQMEREQRQIEQEIELIHRNINSLEEELNRLIEEYQETLAYLYKHGRETELALLFTSASVNQLLVRSHYLGLFDQYRSEQEEEITARQREYEQARADLEEIQIRNDESLANIRQEKSELENREQELQQVVASLQRDQEQLTGQLQQHENELEQLNSTLTELIDEEANIQRLQRQEEERRRRLAEAEQIEDEDERSEAIARYSQPVTNVMAAVSEEELNAFEIGFRDSRGQLPWPVENGTITEKFGERVHPVFNTRTPNPGIDIATAARSQVRVVHDGYVFGVQPFTGFGDVVMVHHGQYITVYGNLSDIFVTRGAVLRRGDVIGLSGDEDSIRGEVLYFMIRDGSENVNPENWLQQTPP